MHESHTKSVDKTTNRTKNNRVGRLAWLLALVAIVITLAVYIVGAILVVKAGDSKMLIWGQLIPFLSMAGYGILGALVVSRRPKNPIGWLFLAVNWIDAIEFFFSVYHAYGPAIGASGYVPAIAQNLWIPSIILPTIFIFLLFPNGRLLSRRWRVIVWSSVLGLIGTHIALALYPGPLPDSGPGVNPNGIAGLADVLDIVLRFARLLLWIGIFGSVAAFVVRFRRSRDIERQQMKCLGYAFSFSLLSIGFGAFAGAFWPTNMLLATIRDQMINLSVLGIAVATSIAILRYRLYNMDLIINRTLVYGALTICVVGVYALVVGSTGILFQSNGNLIVGLAATGSVALFFNPLRQRLQRAVNRLMYGERDEPFAVLRRLGQHLESSGTPEDILPAIVETVSQALKLPYTEITLKNGEKFECAAHYGIKDDELIPFLIQYQGQTIGYLNVAPRWPGETLGKSDGRLLRQIAWQAGAVAHAVQLTRDLVQSRSRLVTAREEERLRLRRDLHDGLGPVLASQGLKIAAIGHLLEADPERARELLDELASQNEASVAEIRRLVYALRPPALDEFGLAGAVREYAAGLNVSKQGNTDFQVNVHQPDRELLGLPPAVEAAAYRIATEALTNVIRHAHARHCTVSLDVAAGQHGDVLLLEVADDGVGLTQSGKSGVGLHSMHERVEEVRGELRVESDPQQGTRIVASFPFTK